MAVSHFPERGGDAIVGPRGKPFLRVGGCLAVLADILSIEAC